MVSVWSGRRPWAPGGPRRWKARSRRYKDNVGRARCGWSGWDLRLSCQGLPVSAWPAFSTAAETEGAAGHPTPSSGWCLGPPTPCPGDRPLPAPLPPPVTRLHLSAGNSSDCRGGRVLASLQAQRPGCVAGAVAWNPSPQGPCTWGVMVFGRRLEVLNSFLFQFVFCKQSPAERQGGS